MTSGITFEVTGLDHLIVYLRGVAARAEDYLLPFEEIATSFHEIETRRFDTGDGWAPLSQFTVDKKGNATILVDSGVLRTSLTSEAGFQEISAAGAIPFIEIGTTVPYATFHQHGFVNHWTGKAVPARPVIDITPENYIAWLEIIMRYLFLGEL